MRKRKKPIKKRPSLPWKNGEKTLVWWSTLSRHGLTPLQKGCGNPSEPDYHSSFSLTCHRTQDFYLSGSMYQEICISTWYPIPSHPFLRLSQYLTHIISTQRHHFPTHPLSLFKIEIVSLTHFPHPPLHILGAQTAAFLLPLSATIILLRDAHMPAK